MPRFEARGGGRPDPRDAKLAQLQQLQQIQGQGEEGDRQGQQAMMQMLEHLYGIQHQQQMGPAEMANLQAETALRTGENQRASQLAPLEQGRLTAETNAANTNAASNTSMRNATEDYRKTQGLKDTYNMMFPPGTSVPPWAQKAVAHGQDLGQAMDQETATTNATNQAAITAEEARQHMGEPTFHGPTQLDSIKATMGKYLGVPIDLATYPFRQLSAGLNNPANAPRILNPAPLMPSLTSANHGAGGSW